MPHRLARDFATNLLSTLNANRMTQRELARRSGISHVHINRLLHGLSDPTLETVYALACAAGTTAENLVRHRS